jgi:hypothetical protein
MISLKVFTVSTTVVQRLILRLCSSCCFLAICMAYEVNVAFRWFLGLGLNDKVPDASTLSQIRIRRFYHSNVYQKIFDEIV